MLNHGHINIVKCYFLGRKPNFVIAKFQEKLEGISIRINCMFAEIAKARKIIRKEF